MNFNQLTIVGFLGKDAQTKVLKNGTTVVNFSVATKRSWKDNNDEWKEKTMWHQVVCYGDGFAALAERLLSGAHVLVQGELTSRDYDRTIQVKAPNGKPFDHAIKQTVIELKADTIRILDRKRDADDPQTGDPDEPQSGPDSEAP